MNGARRTSGVWAALALIGCAASAANAGAGTTPSPGTVAPTPAEMEILSDAKDAPVSIMVFSDYACPYSGKFYVQLAALEKKYPSRLRVMLRQLPLEIHEQSPIAHEAALAAAAQGKLAAMSALLFANQNRLDRDSLLSYAKQIQLDVPLFQKALESHMYRPIVDEDVQEARALGIDSTPTIFLNGQKLTGFQTLDVLDKAVARELANAGAPQSGASEAATAQGEPVIGPEMLAKLTKGAAEVRGAAGAPVTIIEFSDFQCPFCRQTVKPLEDLLAARPNQVRLIFRSYPLEFHQYSELAHEAALAAGAQGKFWQMHDLIFSNQRSLERADLDRFAQQLELDMTAFQHALDQHTYAGEIAADRALGNELAVEGTPTLFINGKRLMGAQSLAELEQLVDQQARLANGETVQEGTLAAATAVEDTHFVVAGSSAAPIHVTWFTDVRSALAGRAAILLQSMIDAYPGQLNVEYKTMQLASHPDAELASRALLAAGGQQKFWPMYELLAGSDAPLDRNDLLTKAAALGIDASAFAMALDSSATSQAIERDQAEETRRAVTGSPAMFIGGARIDGLQPLRVYREAIDAAISAQVGTQAASAAR